MDKKQKQSVSSKIFGIFRIVIFCYFIVSALPIKVLSQPRREWRFALMPNVQYAFPNGSKWLEDFKGGDLKFKINKEVPDTLAGPITAMPVDVWITLDGEYDPEEWEPLPATHSKVQIHFWPLVRSQISDLNEIKYLVSTDAKIFHDRNDLLSRTCLTLFDALEAIYEGATVNLVHRQELSWPPFNEFRNGDKINTIMLPLINYYPNAILYGVIRYARRRSLDISGSDEIRGKLCKELNSRQSAGGNWPLTRISNLFFSGSLPPNFLELGQRQLWPIQTIAEIVLLISKKSGPRLSNNDQRLLLNDLKTICQKLFTDADKEMNAETQRWQTVDNLTNSVFDSVWQITQKCRWALMLCPDQQQSEIIRDKLSRFVRDFSGITESYNLDSRSRVRFRELDYLIKQQDFWAVNNLVSIYNTVKNYSGARVIANTIIDIDTSKILDTGIDLTVEIPPIIDHPIKDPKLQHDANFANFLDNYALALENLEDVDQLLPRLIRRDARNLRKKLPQNP